MTKQSNEIVGSNLNRRQDKPIGLNVQVENISKNPYCDHGPTILFERLLANGGSKKFYACSACRDRKLCSFYLDADSEYSSNSNQTTRVREQDEFFKYHFERFKKCKKITKVNCKEACYCITCMTMFSHCELESHQDCNVIQKISKTNLNFPCQILPPQSNSKSAAQYLFAEKSINVIVQLLKEIKVNKVICIGTPKIHEVLRKEESISSLLLDIDQRFSCFFSTSESLTYNLFNHYFYGGKKAIEIYNHFLTGNVSNCKFALIADPPFGGRMELIANTFTTIQKEWRIANELSDNEVLPTFLVFPYFLERTVLSCLPTFTMLDYKVDYENHDIYSAGPKGMKHGSAVRIFVNLPPAMFPLPENEGYWHCVLCSKWVYENNFHCNKCGFCSSKDGRRYKHCSFCEKCVKPSWVHCQKCKLCAPADHSCTADTKAKKEFSCHTCGIEGHKRRDCPKRKKPIMNSGKSKKRKKEIPQSRALEKNRDAEILLQVLKR